MLTNALRRWTKRINAKTTNRRARLSARRPLLLEQLEDRVVPAVIFNSPFGGDSIFWFPGNGAGMPAYQPVDSPLSSNPTALNSPNVSAFHRSSLAIVRLVRWRLRDSAR